MAEELKQGFSSPKPAATKGVQPSYSHLVYENDADLQLMESVLAELRKTKLGKQLISDAEKYGTTIEMSSGMRAYGSFDEFTKRIRLNPSSSKDGLVGTLAHELRHSQQFQKGLELDALLDTPPSYIHNQGIIESDACVAATEICYELATQGNDKPLEDLRQKDPHIVNPFQNAALNGGLENGEAHKAAFYGWFTDYWTRDAYETNYCSMYRQRYSRSSREESDKKMTRSVSVEKTAALVCTSGGKPYVGKEVKDFFASEDMRTVSFERFNMIYSRVWSDPDVDYKEGADAVMMKKFGLKQRPHASYMPRRKEPELQGPVPVKTAEKPAVAVLAKKLSALKSR